MVKSFQELHAEILACGLYSDGRPIYAERYAPHFAPAGLWQQPDELAALLHYLQDYDITSFLNIGTFNGKTFKLIADFLTARNPATVCVTVDVQKFANLNQDAQYDYCIGTSSDFAEQPFDLVFIDGDHAYASALQDFNNVGRFAHLCVFHDIEDEFIARELPNGGCVTVWRELKEALAATHTAVEFVAIDKPTNNMGLGLFVRSR